MIYSVIISLQSRMTIDTRLAYVYQTAGSERRRSQSRNKANKHRSTRTTLITLQTVTKRARIYSTYIRHSTLGDRAFPVSGPRLWNSLPDDIATATSLLTFRHKLKTFLFRRSYDYVDS